MAMRRSMESLDNRGFWDFVEKTAEEISTWPERTRADVVATPATAAQENTSNADVVRASGTEERSR